MASSQEPTPDQKPHQVGGQNPEHQAIVEKAMKQVSENKGPGQKGDPSKGFTKPKIINKNASTHFHKGSFNS